MRRDRDVEATGRAGVVRGRGEDGEASSGSAGAKRETNKNKHAKGAERLFFTEVSFTRRRVARRRVVASRRRRRAASLVRFRSGVHSTPMTGSWIFSILANSHSLLHSGQFERVRSHLEMQSRWNTCPQLPHAMDNPSSEALVGFAWYSMDGSCRELRQIAHVSVQMDHDHTATAFHCFGRRNGGQRGGEARRGRVASR